MSRLVRPPHKPARVTVVEIVEMAPAGANCQLAGDDAAFDNIARPIRRWVSLT
jgi:hypothetical protein